MGQRDGTSPPDVANTANAAIPQQTGEDLMNRPGMVRAQPAPLTIPRPPTPVTEMPPVPAWLLMAVLLVGAAALALALPSPAGAAVLILALLAICLGWAVLLALYFSRAFMEARFVHRRLLKIAYPTALLLLPASLVIVDTGSGLGWSLLFLLAWGLGCGAAGFVLWSAAKALVFAEEAREVPAEHCLLTFLMCLALPVSVAYLQYRVRAVLAEAREAAARDIR